MGVSSVGRSKPRTQFSPKLNMGDALEAEITETRVRCEPLGGEDQSNAACEDNQRGCKNR
jgi:hypothetical protein